MLVSIRLRPAVAPLRRVIDQVLRLIDVMAPVLGDDDDEPQTVSRQDRRQQAREAAKSAQTDEDNASEALTTMRRLLLALRDDLDHSGMIDVVVEGDDGPGVVLTLDKRYADQTALELIHTSGFTAIGKITQIWPTEDDVVFLFRRSVLALLPGLSQQVVVALFAFLAGAAKEAGIVDFEQSVREAMGIEEATPAEPREFSFDDIAIGNDIAALSPVLDGPAIQILPLALCV